MKLALIPPHDRISDINHTNYQLALAHLFADVSEVGNHYTWAYDEARRRGDYIILDNGAYEGSLVSANELTNLANDFMPNEVVIPDNIKNAAITQEMAEQYYNNYRPSLDPDIGLVFVAQGSNTQEMLESIQWATQQDWLKTIALPKHTLETCQNKDARLIFAEFIKAHSNCDIHFLGASPLWTDEIRAARDSGIVRGMDTSMPYVYGYNYETLPSDQIIDSKESRSFYFNIEGDHEQNDIITRNVKGMIDCVNEL